MANIGVYGTPIGLTELSRASYRVGSGTGYLIVYEATATKVGFSYGVYYGIVSVD